MDNNICYIPENVIQINNAGSKAREDIEIILRDYDLKPLLTLDFELLSKKSAKLQFGYWHFLYSLYAVRNKWIIMQYPVYGGKIIKKCFEHLINHNKLIFIIHDLEYLRFDNSKKQALHDEVCLLNKAAVIVSHNSFMTKRMRQDGVTVPIIELELFDYLLSEPVPATDFKLGKQVVFAGNLEKSEFLKRESIENLDLELILYGSGFDKHKMGWRNIHYAGSFKPNDIPYKLKGSFGLIWDGTSVEICDGQTGEYMRFNNPHKLSLYIIAGLPVIVWKKAAIATFVENHQIGIMVDSLDEIPGKIQKLTEKEYEKIRNNVKKLQGRLTVGYYTKKALSKVNEIMMENKS